MPQSLRTLAVAIDVAHQAIDGSRRRRPPTTQASRDRSWSALERNLPTGGTQANALARGLDRWIRANPRPYVGLGRIEVVR